MDENDFEIPIARFLHFVKMSNWRRIVYQEIVHGSEFWNYPWRI